MKLSASGDDVNSRRRVWSRRLDILDLQLKLGLEFGRFGEGEEGRWDNKVLEIQSVEREARAKGV
jgi:hypothetical protein